ncbi:acyltransferase family protein [Sphingomonas sp. GB1N7]|uniref:acyltransferase family protein n=1 Tax=Parasphingomonas caseinilytica TaxID=3096158 RepID=UPI002FC5E710
MTGETKHRYVALDSLRGVCACMIVLLHFDTFGYISRSAFVQHSFLFVDFFFVLSGFVIAASYGDRLGEGYSIPKFMMLRLGRVYPLHIVMLALFVAWELATINIVRPSGRLPFSDGYTVGMIFANLGLVQTFIGHPTSWNGPAWSIAVEVWTYLVFAFGFRYLGRFLVLVALILAVVCGCYLLTATDRYLNVFHEGAFARCLIGFSLGVVTFRAHRYFQPRLGVTLATLLEIVAVAATIAIVVAAGASILSLAVPPLFALVILVFAQQSGAMSRVLILPPLEFLGKVSYSIYMVHLFIVFRTHNALEAVQRVTHHYGLVTTIDDRKFAGSTPLMGDILSIMVLCMAIVAATLSYKLVEFPANQWVRRKVSTFRQSRSS